MKVFALALIASSVVFVQSQINSTQHVTLSCPAIPEGNRGPARVLGRRGSKGDLVSRCKSLLNAIQRRFALF